DRDAAGAGGRNRRLYGWLQAHDGDMERLPQHLQSGTGRRVAGHHDDLRPPVYERPGHGYGAIADLVERLLSVRDVGRIGDVEDVFLRQPPAHLPCYAQTAQPGIKDPDGTLATHLLRPTGNCASIRTPPPLAGRTVTTSSKSAR